MPLISFFCNSQTHTPFNIKKRPVHFLSYLALVKEYICKTYYMQQISFSYSCTRLNISHHSIIQQFIQPWASLTLFKYSLVFIAYLRHNRIMIFHILISFNIYLVTMCALTKALRCASWSISMWWRWTYVLSTKYDAFVYILNIITIFSYDYLLLYYLTIHYILFFLPFFFWDCIKNNKWVLELSVLDVVEVL